MGESQGRGMRKPHFIAHTASLWACQKAAFRASSKSAWRHKAATTSPRELPGAPYLLGKPRSRHVLGEGRAHTKILSGSKRS
jgi:hypothetical protein